MQPQTGTVEFTTFY